MEHFFSQASRLASGSRLLERVASSSSRDSDGSLVLLQQPKATLASYHEFWATLENSCEEPFEISDSDSD